MALPLLMELVHVHLVKEYIVWHSKWRLVLRTAEQQQQLAGQVLANANLIERFCTQHVSTDPPNPPSIPPHTPPNGLPLSPGPLPAQCSGLTPAGPGALLEPGSSLQPGPCPQGSPATWLQPALSTLAEIIRLQDPSAIKIEVATYATLYPDFR